MTTDAETLRANLSKLYVDRTIGDVTERAFMRKSTEKTVDLYRAIVLGKLVKGEELVAEHHTISSHFRVTQSVLREPEQHGISYFMTNRRLLRLRSTIAPGQPPTADLRDGTRVDSIRLDRVTGLSTKRQFRWGEAGVGAMMCCLAAVFASWLEITGPVLIGLGGLGILHTLLRPTRWVEVKTTAAKPESDPILIHAVGKKSARKLIRLLRERVSRP